MWIAKCENEAKEAQGFGQRQTTKKREKRKGGEEERRGRGGWKVYQRPIT